MDLMAASAPICAVTGVFFHVRTRSLKKMTFSRVRGSSARMDQVSYSLQTPMRVRFVYVRRMRRCSMSDTVKPWLIDSEVSST